ncbi:recombination protein RecR [bacterium]|nr:recombination protein RecR [bacterium]
MQKIVKQLFNYFKGLPDIGNKTAERIVFSLLSSESRDIKKLYDSLHKLIGNKNTCSTCGVISFNDPCDICSDESRENTLMIVESSKEYYKIELSGSYRGKYHVLGGIISPFQKRNFKDLNINNIKSRIENEGISEVIIGISPIPESVITKEMLMNLLKDTGVRITEFARGISTGQYVENIDEVTLTGAIKDRKDAEY